jgi:hypothetical protein
MLEVIAWALVARGEVPGGWEMSVRLRPTLLGVGAMNSPRYAPEVVLVEYGAVRVAVDGGPGGAPRGRLDAWLVTDERAELIRALRRLTAADGLVDSIPN